MHYNSACDFFTPYIPNFQKYLAPYISSTYKVDALEIGCLEGRSAVWMLENVLTHPDSTITCVDSNGMNTLNVLSYNLASFVNKTRLIIHPSTIGLSILIVEKRRFDCVYMDGQHDDYVPLSDLVMIHELIKVGGIIGIDDYLMPDTEQYGKSTIKKCFDYFMDVYQDYYVRLTTPDIHQQWIQKVK